MPPGPGRPCPTPVGGPMLPGRCMALGGWPGLPNLPSSRALTEARIAVTVFENVYKKRSSEKIFV
jgi:hypothetical protein